MHYYKIEYDNYSTERINDLVSRGELDHRRAMIALALGQLWRKGTPSGSIDYAIISESTPAPGADGYAHKILYYRPIAK